MQKLIVTLIVITGLLVTLVPTTSIRAEDDFIIIERSEDTLALCDKALSSCEAEIEALKKLVTAEREFGDLMKKQRDNAYDKIETNSNIPFYVWVVVGVAGGVILTRGIR